MKGIILSGGEGSRLYPLTIVTSKQLLPIGNEPMIFYPVRKMVEAGITDILIITAPHHGGHYLNALGDYNFGEEVNFSYKIQPNPGGLAQAFLLGERFLKDGDNVTMILGDNLFDADLSEPVKNFQSGAH